MCPNKTTCKFEGYGTYKWLINNNLIELKKVYFSKETNKNLISGIKLAEENKIEGIITNVNGKAGIILKTKSGKVIGKYQKKQYKYSKINN